MTESTGGNLFAHVVLNLESFRPPDDYDPEFGHLNHQESFSTTRTALHRDHKIKIETTYRIEIDDKPLTLHTVALDDGTVHCHGLPNYSFPSAIDLAKSIIDAAALVSIPADQIGDNTPGHLGDTDQHASQNAHGGEDHQ